MRRSRIVAVVQDAISDRESYLDAVKGDRRWVALTTQDLGKLGGLLSRYDGPGRVVLREDEREVLREACRFAFIWRRGLLDSYSGTGDRAKQRSLAAEIREAEGLYSALGGQFRKMEGTYVSLDEIRAGAGTHVVETSEGGGTMRTISEDSVLLGIVSEDADGVVSVKLADGKIINRPFPDMSAAQRWLLGKFSKNLIFARDEQDEVMDSYRL